MTALPAPFAGVDRSWLFDRDHPERKAAKGAKPLPPAKFLVPWMEELYRRSNLDFCGFYLTLADDAHEHEINGSARNEKKGWTKGYPDLIRQGWGLAFFYVGYTIRYYDMKWVAPKEIWYGPIDEKHKGLADPKKMAANKFPESMAIDHGKLHGQHIKSAVRHLASDNAGAVVFLDNEGNWK